MTVTVDFRDHGFHVRVTGRLDRAANREMITRAWHDPHWDEAKYALVDMRAVTSIHIAEGDMVVQASLANAGSLSTMKTRTATVFTHPEIGRLCEIYHAHLNHGLCEARAFQDYDTALDWARGTAVSRAKPQFRGPKWPAGSGRTAANET